MMGKIGIINQKITYFCEEVIKYGLPILYFLVSVAFYLKTYDSAQIKITLIQIGGVVLLAVWLIKIIEENINEFLKENLIIIIPLLAFLLSGIISYFHSPFALASGNELTRRVLYIAMSLIVIKEFNSEKKFSTLLAGFLLHVI
jgi:hypothetical protein